MSARALRKLPLSFVGLLALGCNDDPAGDDEAGETTSADTGTETGTTGDTGTTSDTGTTTTTTTTTSDDTGGSEDGLDELPPCGEPPDGGGVAGAPTLVSAEFVDELVVQLNFSEPMAPVDELDPSAFRISIARFDANYAQTTYWDPMLWFCSHTDACLGDYTDVVELGCVADDPNALLLRLDVFWGDYICPILDNQAMYGYVSDILPHFDAAIAPVTDAEGEALESFGADWVGYDELAMIAAGEFPAYPAPIPIPCP